MVPLKESADKKKMEGKGTASRKEAQQAEAAKKELRPCNQHVAVCFLRVAGALAPIWARFHVWFAGLG